MEYSNIILCGFGSVGKTVAGSAVAEQLGWEYVDLDDEIVKAVGTSISELTRGGTEWQAFRQIEVDLLVEMLEREKAVISLGGGVGVNNIIKDGTDKTFGEIGTDILNKAENNLVVLLTSDEEDLQNRIVEKERVSLGSRPILDSKVAKEVQEATKGMSEEDTKEFHIKKKAEDAIKMFRMRKTLYAKLTGNVINTGEQTVDETVNGIISLLSN